MTLNEAKRILEDRAKNLYDQSIEWYVNQIDNGNICLSQWHNKKTKVIDAYKEYRKSQEKGIV